MHVDMESTSVIYLPDTAAEERRDDKRTDLPCRLSSAATCRSNMRWAAGRGIIVAAVQSNLR